MMDCLESITGITRTTGGVTSTGTAVDDQFLVHFFTGKFANIAPHGIFWKLFHYYQGESHSRQAQYKLALQFLVTQSC